MKPHMRHCLLSIALLMLSTSLGWGCAQESSHGGPLAVGESTTALPINQAEEKDRLFLLQNAREVSLTVYWNGSPLQAPQDEVLLKFYRQGDDESYYETSWSALVERSKESACGRKVENSKSQTNNVHICDGSLGLSTQITKVEGKRTKSGETKSTALISRSMIDDKMSAMEIHFY